ncbi:TIGR03086 family metal-binding protein [Actinomadura sp. GC306]|uniref:TIGR03086 family metal-binding protein n=1 Tax=Actinomadura sp. GC306 TaxID=2530367 RepID=UPI001A9FA920|nr:TIGR03086 family metal-binding protein [Actinomadura sp. GC306]
MLERAIGFALTSVQAVTPDMLPRRTPCASWDLEMLLLHLGESLSALHEGLALGSVKLASVPLAQDAHPVSVVRVSAIRVLRASGALGRVEIGDRRLEGDLMAAAGAVEVAVHGWDIAQASGERRPVPCGLAEQLLKVCPAVMPGVRDRLFAEPVESGPDADAGERLVARLGRRPLR